jgi:cytochrome b561
MLWPSALRGNALGHLRAMRAQAPEFLRVLCPRLNFSPRTSNMATQETTPLQFAPPRYDSVSRLLHWLTLALLIAQYALGWFMPDVNGTAPPAGLQIWHVGVGTTLLAVVAARLVWALLRPSPAPVVQSNLLNLLASIVHKLLYVLLIAVPLLGWLNASGRNWVVQLGGLVNLPQISTHGSIGAAIGEWHSASTILLLVVIGLHVAAALFHQFRHKDNLLGRML